MPASPQLAQFLAPQRPGEQVPDTQIATAGPFSAELAQPAFRPPPVRETGFGGKGHALLSFANNFLAGASEGRLRQFQQSEQTKKEHERNFDATVQHIMDSPEYSKEFKEQTFQNALKIKASAGLAALGGGKGSGKNDHPLVGMAKHLFSGVVGPSENVKHADIGPEHVSDLISQMHAPENKFSLADTMTGAQANVGEAIKKIQSQAGSAGVPIYREDIMNHPEVVNALKPLYKQGYDPYAMPEIGAAFSALPSRPTAAQLTALKAAEARTNMYTERGTTEKLKRSIPVTFIKDGKSFSAEKRPDGKYYYLNSDIPVPGDVMSGASLASTAPSWTAGTRIVQQADGSLAEVPNVVIRGKGAPPVATPGSETPPTAGGVQIPEVAPGQPGRQQLAFKNNNPLNLEFRNQPGAVLGEDGRFAKFENPEAGFAAGINQVKLDQTRPHTLESYIAKFAPAGGTDKNNPALYALNAAKALGVDPKTPLSEIDSQKLAAFQAKQESSTTIDQGTPAPPTVSGGPKIVGKKTSTVVAPPLTDEAIRTKAAKDPSLDYDAWTYMLERKFNVRGIGKAATEGAENIKHRAGQIMADLGLDPGELFARGASLKSDIAALSKVSTQGAQIASFEGTLLRNAEIARKLSEAFSRTDIPFLNRIVAAFKTGTGDDEAKNLAAQLHGLSQEWAKIMAGSVSSNGVAIRNSEQTDGIIANGIANGQLNSLIDNVIIPDAKNRTSAFEEEKTKLRDKIRGSAQGRGSTGTPAPPLGGPVTVMGHVFPNQAAADAAVAAYEAAKKTAAAGAGGR